MPARVQSIGPFRAPREVPGQEPRKVPSKVPDRAPVVVSARVLSIVPFKGPSIVPGQEPREARAPPGPRTRTRYSSALSWLKASERETGLKLFYDVVCLSFSRSQGVFTIKRSFHDHKE